MHDLISKHTKYVIFPILAVLSAAILFHQSGVISQGYDQVSVGDIGLSGFFIFTYLCLLFAAFVKRSDQRDVLILLGSLAAVYTGIPWTNRIFEYRGDFYKYTNTDYWHILVLTLLILFVSIALVIASWERRAIGVHYVKELLASAIKGSHKILTLAMLISLAVLLFFLLKELWESLFLEYVFLGDYLYSEVLIFVRNTVIFLIALLGLAVLQPVVIKWLDVVQGWALELRDFSFKTYLTRKISSALYALTYAVAAGFIGLGVPVYTYEALGLRELLTGVGFLGPIFFFPLGVALAAIVWFLVILIVRLAYEFTNAIIHIAENSPK